jgi:hypothetical protein
MSHTWAIPRWAEQEKTSGSAKHFSMTKRRLTFLFIFLSLTSLLAIGAIKARQDYLLLGIPRSLPEPIAYNDTRLGLNVYLQQYNEQSMAQTLAEIADLGINIVKQPFYFEEPFDWAASDRIVSAVRSQDIELVPLLDGSPTNQFAPPADPAVFAA